MPVRRIRILIAVIFGLSAPSAQADLAGDTRFETPRAGWADIVLDTPLHVGRGGYNGRAPSGPVGATFTELDGRDFRFLAVQLRSLAPGPDGWFPSLFGVHLNGKTHTLATDNVLPAGAYQLLVFSDGRDLSGGLQIDGRAGTQSVRLAGELEVVSRRASATADRGQEATTGTGLTTTRPAFIHKELDFNSNNGPTRTEICSYEGASPGVYTVGCGSEAQRKEQLYPGAVNGLRVTTSLFDMAPAFYGFGGNVRSAGTSRLDVYSVAVSIPVEGLRSAIVPVSRGDSERVGVAVERVVLDRSRRSLAIRVRCDGSSDCNGRLLVAGFVARAAKVRGGSTRTLKMRAHAQTRRRLKARRPRAVTVRFVGAPRDERVRLVVR